MPRISTPFPIRSIYLYDKVFFLLKDTKLIFKYDCLNKTLQQANSSTNNFPGLSYIVTPWTNRIFVLGGKLAMKQCYELVEKSPDFYKREVKASMRTQRWYHSACCFEFDIIIVTGSCVSQKDS